MDWLTIQQLDKDTRALSEPRHWEETHAYLLAGTKRALLIDTGLGVCDLFSTVRSLTFLPVTVALTHAHWDHIGGCNVSPAPWVHRLEVEPCLLRQIDEAFQHLKARNALEQKAVHSFHSFSIHTA